MDTHNFANALSNIFRNLVPAQNQQQEPNHEIRDEQRLGSGESSATPNTVSEPSQAIENGASASQPILDVEMDTVNSSEIIDDDDEMPALQSVSDSDSEDDDLDEVEMQTHDDDQANRNAFANGGAGDRLMPTSVPHQQESSANPASSASSTPSAHGRPNRRARVEDDDDEERDRRHPFERVGTPRNSAPTSTPAPNATPATPAPSGAAPPPQLQPQELRAALNDVMGLFLQELRQRMETRLDPGQQQQQQQQQAQQNPQTQNQQPPQPQNNNGNGFPTFQNLFEGGDAGGFAITFDITSNGPQPVTIAHHATRPGNGQGPPGSRSNPISMDSDALLNFFNILQFLPINTGPEIEDPERAKQLIDALEEVPEGLIRRMERVSEGVDLSGTGDVNCAICWDRLLDSEGGTGWEKKEEQKNDEHEHDHDHTHSDSEHPSSDVSTSSAPAPPSSDDHPASSSSTESSESKSNRIVSLPCAHVFHASCLIPWFSRPRQTTCPTCRFNIDPENLTYRPQARPARRNATGTQTNTTPVATQTPGEAQAQTQTLPTDTNPVVDQAIPAPAPPPANADTQGEAGMDEHSRGTADNLQDELNRLERLREVLQRRIDEAENEERELVEAIMNNGEVPMPMPMDMAAAAIANAALGQNARAPRNAGPNTIPAPGANANANAGGDNNDDAPNGPQDGIHSVLTIGFDVIIGPAPSGNFPMGNTPGADQPQARDQVPGQGQGQGQNAPQGAQRFGAPFGAGMRTGAGGTNVQWATGSGRTINEAFASLFADGAIGGNRPVPIVVGGGNAPPAGNAPQPPPVVFGPPPPPQAGPRNGDGEGFTFGQIFSRMFGGQGRGQTQPQPQPQTQPQAPPTQLPPFMGVNLGPLPASSNEQPAPVSTPNANANNRGPANEPNAQPRTNLPPLAQHFANMFGGIPGFPPGAVFVGGNAGGNATGIPTGATGPRTAPAPGGPPRPPPPPRERKKWALPAPPGPTLRQRIEKAEREAGLRCYDTSCGVGPSDEEPFTALTDAAKKQLSIQDADEKGDGAVVNVCPHTFHPSCLVSAARVALMGEDATVSKDGGRVEVACSVCRCDGSVLKHDWDEGVDALK